MSLIASYFILWVTLSFRFLGSSLLNPNIWLKSLKWGLLWISSNFIPFFFNSLSNESKSTFSNGEPAPKGFYPYPWLWKGFYPPNYPDP